jgi:hypothetical protein
MRLVIVESPYGGEIERNIAYARAALRDCLKRSEAPLASHLLYTQPGVLDDAKADGEGVRHQRWPCMGREGGRDVVYTDLGISAGMRLGIERAQKAGRAKTCLSPRASAQWACGAG